MSLKFTPENITSLGEDEIFVFGSDPKGERIGPAEETAIKNFGASAEQPVGIRGQSYGIPTMFDSVDIIKPYVDEFIALAREWDQTTSYITRDSPSLRRGSPALQHPSPRIILSHPHRRPLLC